MTATLQTIDLPEATPAVLAGTASYVPGSAPSTPEQLEAQDFAIACIMAVRGERGADGTLLRPDFDDFRDQIVAAVDVFTNGTLAQVYFGLVTLAYESARAGRPPIQRA